jgi:hypothetical protein
MQEEDTREGFPVGSSVSNASCEAGRNHRTAASYGSQQQFSWCCKKVSANDLLVQCVGLARRVDVGTVKRPSAAVQLQQHHSWVGAIC